MFRRGQPEHGAVGRAEAAGSPAVHIALVSQPEISQAIRPRRWLRGEAAGGKLFKSPCYTPAMGSASCSASPSMCSLLPTASQLAQDPSEAAGGTGGPQHLCETPGLTEQRRPQQPLTPPWAQGPWGIRKRTPRALPALGRATANTMPGPWYQASCPRLVGCCIP